MLRGYRGMTSVETRLVKPGMDYRMSSMTSFAFEKPNRLRNESIINSSTRDVDLFSNGAQKISYMKEWKQYRVEQAPEVSTSDDLETMESYVAKNIILSHDPSRNLKRGIEDVNKAGDDMLNGISTTVIELHKSAASLGTRMVPTEVNTDIMIPVRLWIGQEDNLIHRLAYEVDMEQVVSRMPEEQRARMQDYYAGMKVFVTETHKDIETDPDFADDYFDFVVPQGTQLVEKFVPPNRPGSEQSIAINEPAPGFTLRDTEGIEASLSDFEGKVVLIDFWATWCSPCIEAMPDVQVLHEIYKERDVVVLGINSWEQQKENVKPFLKEHKITYRILLDSDDDVIKKYRVRGIPTFFVLDKKGTVRYSYTGMPPGKQVIQQSIEQLLGE
jgi:peroxiredoxin